MNPSRALPLQHRRLIICLACVPAMDAVVNQLSNGLQLTLGPVSLLQVLRSFLVVCFVMIVVWQIRRDASSLSRIPIAACAAMLLLLIVVSKEFVLSGSLAAGSAVAYGQMAYWVLLWVVVALVCRDRAQAIVLLRGLAAGALITAGSVVLGYFYGGLNYYDEATVHSSSGWFDTAKMITGLLVCGTIVLLYLGHASKSWLSPLLAIFCCVACMLTYARAGSVALAAVVLWLVVWTVHNFAFNRWRSLNRFLVMTAVLSCAVVLVVPADSLFSRWGDVSDSDQAGSGRATIWRVARAAYADGSAAQQALGRGYSSMSELLLTGYGDDVKHTHNDMLDMLLVGGAAGAVFLVLFVGTLGSATVQRSIWTLEGGASLAVLIDYLCHSQLTGQIWGTDAMTYYVIAITCFSVVGASVRASAPATSFALKTHAIAC